MSAEAKALLDELMGRSRNLDPSEQTQDVSWESDDVCKHFLCGFCPHELFTNTRADLGSCNKIHDDALRKEYEKHPRFEKCGYEEEFMRFLQFLINDVEKRIRRGHQRLALNGQQGNLLMNGNVSNENEEKAQLLTDKINQLVEQAEELGCEGKVEESQGVMKLVDQLKEERQNLEKPAHEDSPLMKQMEVCEVCGAFLIVGDAPQRQDEHLMGKQHAGYAQVRAEIERRKQKVRDKIEAREATEAKLKTEREEREKERQREREERRKKDRDLEKEKERSKDKRRRSRSRSRDRRTSRNDDKRRSRSRDRRGSSRDHKRGHRSRSRDKDRDRRRRSRSGSRGRHSSHRSSSKDRRSSRRSSRDRHRSRSKDRKSKSSQDKERDPKHSSKSGKDSGYDKKTDKKSNGDHRSSSSEKAKSVDGKDETSSKAVEDVNQELSTQVPTEDVKEHPMDIVDDSATDGDNTGMTDPNLQQGNINEERSSWLPVPQSEGDTKMAE